MADHLAGAVAGRVQRISLVHRHHGKTGRRCHFKNRLVLAELPVVSPCALHERPEYVQVHLLAVFRGDDRIGRALSAVGYRNAAVLNLSEDVLRCLREKLYGLLA